MISVIIITSNRDRHLNNALLKLSQSTIIPDEIIIVSVNTAAKVDVYHDDLPIRHELFTTSDGSFDYAGARNWGARCANYESLVFLDVDVLMATDALAILFNDLKKFGGLVMATPRYLRKKKLKSFSDYDLFLESTFHPDRPSPDLTAKLCDIYTLFWSLAFAVKKSDFNALEGFDTNFKGYGGEDTDFALRAEALGLPFTLSPALIYHQMHSVFSPPVDKLEGILKNSKTFFDKWKFWPMENYLTSFRNLQLINWNPDGDEIVLKHLPTDELIEACHYSDRPYI